MNPLLITLLLGAQIAGLPDIIPTTWMHTFKAYPYLYKGTLEESREYFKYYSLDERSILFIATVGDKFAGFLNGAPLASVEPHFKGTIANFQKAELDPYAYYYIGDIIVLPEFRGKKITSELLHKLEQHAASWGYTNVCLVTSDREDNHPLKPTDFENSANNSAKVWDHLGFSKTDMRINKEYSTIIDAQGNAEEHENSMVFWIKKINHTAN